MDVDREDGSGGERDARRGEDDGDNELLRRAKLEEVVLETKSLRRIISAYLNYPDAAERDVRRYERSFRKLPPVHKALLSHLPLKYQRLRWCIHANKYFLMNMLEAFEPPFDMSQVIDGEDGYLDCSTQEHAYFETTPKYEDRNLKSGQTTIGFGEESFHEVEVAACSDFFKEMQGSLKNSETCEKQGHLKECLESSEKDREGIQGSHGDEVTHNGGCDNVETIDDLVQDKCRSAANGSIGCHPCGWWDSSLQLNVPLADVDKVRCIIRNIVRDWAAEGQKERDQCYKPILEELVRLFPTRSNERPPTCLVPGAGLGRLALEISLLGFVSQGNEFSYYMMICSSFILNHTQSVGEWTIYPWIHSNCNSLSDGDQLRAVSFPDIHPASAGITEGFSMCGGDFVEVYNDANQEEMPKSRKGPKTSEGNRNDPAWKYCVQLEMEESQKAKGYVYVQCNFCGKRITGGVARLKHHLAKTGKNVKGCAQVPDEVLNEMKAILSSNEEKSKRAMMEMEELCRAGSFEVQNPFGGGENQAISPSGSSNMKRARGPMDVFLAGPSPLGSPSPTTTIGMSGHQTTLNETWKKEERNRVCRTIGRFFFENGLPFNCASSPSFSAMLHAVGSFGRGLKPPSAYELKSWILKEEVKSIWDVMGEARASWAETGCSIMSDGWTDVKGRSLINFLVNNPKGTWFLKSVDASDKVKNATLLFQLLDEIVEEVGECNVLQVITDNASNYKAAGQLLMEKRKHLYWTPCAAHCIDLMLEDILKLPLPTSVFKKAKRIINYIYAHGWVLAMVRKQIGGDLVRPAVTRFATAFLTLQKLMSMKDPLESFFTSSKWKKSPYASKPQGKSVSQTILRSKTFWPGVAYVIRTTKPLVMVLRMVDSEKYPPMGFIYEAMDRAKEEIAKALGNDETKYRTLWDIVDDRWDRQLHTNLHAAAYFLNPQCQYEPSFSKHFEIKRGLFDCIARIIEDQSVREKIDLQIDAFKHARGFFGWESATSTRKKRSPADWWSQFGDECPELQKFAIRVLSLTCSASGCERNWSSFNQIHTKRRNRLTQAKLNDLVYVMFNLKLKQREIRRKTMEDPLCLDDVDSSDEWVSELQSCDFEAYQELDANTPIEDEVVEAEDEADQQDNSRRKRRKDKASWDAVVTCFFLDTAHNIVEYVEIISKILKDGGVWINVGPLLYHFAESYSPEDEMSIELSLEDVKRVVLHYGFKIEVEKTIETTYTTNPRSMMQNRYFAVFWTMKKTIQE